MGNALAILPLLRTNKAHTFSPTSGSHDINAAAKYGQTFKEYNHCSYTGLQTMPCPAGMIWPPTISFHAVNNYEKSDTNRSLASLPFE